MKNNVLRPLTAALLASAMAFTPIVALAQATDPAASAPTTPSVPVTVNVTGKVTAQTSTTLTVDGRTVTLTKATTFSRAGTAIGSGDVKVGDSVNIVTSDDGQVAVSVNVTASP